MISSAFILACFYVGSIAAQDSIEGKYAEINPPQPTQTGDKIEVLEVFWYGCPHCYSFEPHIEAWLEDLPGDVEFIRVPGVLNRGWIPHAKAYYVAEKLGVVDKIHRPLFDAIHKDKRRLFTEDELMDFFVEHGVSAGDFERVISSKELDTKIRQAYFLARDYKLTGVPSVVVNGKYLISASHIRTFEEMIQVTNALVERERN
ncbi:MAG: thiol:disulfide interchange protein DsbA/DsbL [Gammaproteobacteria bacterium]|nr:thiol:disulfide interchange protein DsbA/DsbL [Gammaproteobacteria bacterium]